MNAFRHGLSTPIGVEDILDGQGVKGEESRSESDHEQQEIMAHLRLHRLQSERVKLLSNGYASKDLAQLMSALRQVAALKRYEGRIFAYRKRCASKTKGGQI
jgi:hypothetical protein